MAHLSPNFTSFETFLQGADAWYATDLTALNSSGVSGQVLFSVDYDETGTSYLNVAVTAQNVATGAAHAQHIHGVFDENGDPANSVTPTIGLDADGDGMVEVLEGVGAYGDVLLPLTDGDGAFPMPDAEGNLQFFQSYDISDDTLFQSPFGNQYSFEDLLPMELREYVLHGMVIPEGIGAGTGGEVNGTGGFIGLLPAAAGEIEAITQAEALAQLADQQRAASTSYVLTGDDDIVNTGDGMDTVNAGAGNDTVFGAGGSDYINGFAGDDELFGGEGHDTIGGGDGQDLIYGGIGNDALAGGLESDTIAGGLGDDVIVGGAGNDLAYGDSGNDQISGGVGDDSVYGGKGDDLIYGKGGADVLYGDMGDDQIGGGNGDDSVFGGDGNDFISGSAGNDLVVGGGGDDIMFGGTGNDVMGGGGGNDRLTGNAGLDEFHFDAGAGTDIVRDFTQGEDVISFLDGGAISFANSMTNSEIGTADLDAADFDTVMSIMQMDAANDQQVVYSTGGSADAMTGMGAMVEAYVVATDGTDSHIFYDDDWSTVEGRELLAILDNVNTAMTLSDFDVY